MPEVEAVAQARTLRRDAWWTEIIPVIALLGGFGVYATLRGLEGKFYEFGPYLSPFYSPLIDPGHLWWRFSPAILVMGGPLLFRLTCYYYRKAYYRAFFFDPPACAVGEGRGKYGGETYFPFILQNLHRFTLYLAIVYLIFLWRDAIRGFFFNGHFGIAIGSLVLFANIIFLTLYTGSCHSLRHLSGGRIDCFSCAAYGRPRHGIWGALSFLNEHHMLFAWCSLVSVGLADLYVRLASSGAIRDVKLL